MIKVNKNQSEPTGEQQIPLHCIKTLVNTAREPFLILDFSLRVISANDSFCRTFSVSRKETEKKTFYDIGNRQWDIPELRRLLEKILPEKKIIRDYEFKYNFSELGKKVLRLNAQLIESTRFIVVSFEDITAKEQLAESEEFHKALVYAADRAGIGIAILQNVKGREAAIVSVNNHACYISGYTREECLKLSISDVIPVDMLSQILERYRKRQQGKSVPYFYETDIIRKDKKRVPILISLAITKIKGEIATIVYFRDITEIKRVELMLQESENKLNATIQGSPIPKFVIDQNHKVIHWNTALEKYSGIKAKEILGTNQQWRAFYLKKRPCLADLLVDGAIERIPQWYTGKYTKSKLIPDAYEATDFFPQMGENGIWLYFTASVIRDAKSDVIGAMETLEDITERKKAEEELKKHEEELENTQKALLRLMDGLDREKIKLINEKAKDEAILGNIADGVVVVDKEGKIIVINQAARKMLGFESSEALGKPWSEILRRQDEEGHFISSDTGAVQAALLKEKVTRADSYYYVRKNKTRFPVLRSVSPIILDKKVVGAVNVFRDITREKEIDRMKDEFISVASHELRTPMTAIMGNIDMVLKGKAGQVSHEVKEYLKDVAIASDRLIKLVNDMLDVSHIEVGRLMFNPKPIDISVLIHSVVKECQAMAKEKNLILKYNPGKNLPKVSADPDKVLQVLNNIIGNAIKFTPEGSVTITTKQKQNKVIVQVKDTGIGIRQEDKDKIFQKFFQLDTSLSREIKGTGLGLYISQQMVKKMGGEIWLESEGLGRGTIISFSLPKASKK
ncbi:MAG: PAS domain S-box protein [Patescibacteria group bacterium]